VPAEPNPDSAAREYYAKRAEEFRLRYEAMRTLEWQTLIQTYTGYGAIIVAFQKASERFEALHTVSPFTSLAALATLGFAVAMHYLHYRVEERLITFNENHQYYARKMHQGSIVEDAPGTRRLGHPYFWTYDIQMGISAFTVLGMMVYESIPGAIPTLKIATAAWVAAIAVWGVSREKLGRLPDEMRSYHRGYVWYASYGSNLAYRRRFLCYIEGGKPAGSNKESPGCRDKTHPSAIRPITLNYELFFAGHFRGWDGAAAFIKSSTGDAVSLGRMYLISYDQFNDVVLQENGREVDGASLIPPYERLVHEKEHLLPGLRTYGRLLLLGNDEEGRPILTFTSPEDIDLPVAPPSEPYVKIIAAGIKETYPAMKNSDIVAYLLRSAGVRDRIQPDQLSKWVAEA
jgi:hypothetical protein